MKLNNLVINETAQQQDIKKTAGNVSSTLIIRLLRYPFLGLYFIIIPRMMGASQYGQYALLISLLMLLSEVLSLGSPVALGKLFPEMLHRNEIEKAQKLLSGYLSVWLITSLLLLTAGVLFISFQKYSEFSTWTYFIFYLALISEIFSQLFFSLLFGLNEVGKYNLVHLFRTAFRFIFLFLLFPVWGFTGAMLTLLITPLVSLLYAYYNARKHFPIRFILPDFRSFIPGFRFGLMLFAPTLLFIVQQQSGPLLLKLNSIGNAEIAFFDLANQSYLVLYGLAVTIYETLIPISAKFEVTGLKEKGKSWLILLFRYMMSAFIIIFFGFSYFGEEIIRYLLGSEYENMFQIALLILLSIPFWSIGQIGYVRSVILSKPKVYFLSTIISTITYIVFSSILIIFFGGKGIASAVILSAAAYATVMLINYPEFKDKVFHNLKRLITAGLLFIPGLFIKEFLSIKILYYIIGSLIFLWELNRFRIIDKEEIRGVLSSLRFNL